MTQDDEVCLKLGREIVRMVHDLRAMGDEASYGRRKFTYPGGEFYVILVNQAPVADAMESAVKATYHVKDILPPSQMN